MEDNLEMTKKLSALMEDYTMAQIEVLKLKTEFATEWADLRRIYASRFGQDNDENDRTASNSMPTSSHPSLVEKKKATLSADEKKCTQVSK
jgi:hypothetical protein